MTAGWSSGFLLAEEVCRSKQQLRIAENGLARFGRHDEVGGKDCIPELDYEASGEPHVWNMLVLQSEDREAPVPILIQKPPN